MLTVFDKRLFQVIVTVGLAFIVRRKHLYPSCCWQRPGILQWVLSVSFSHSRVLDCAVVKPCTKFEWNRTIFRLCYW